jgi:hypothetical protein
MTRAERFFQTYMATVAVLWLMAACAWVLT